MDWCRKDGMEAGTNTQGHGIHPSFAGVIRQRERIKTRLAGIKHKIGVYSAKGGVGKTTISVNLAFTLAGMGLRVGILDADVDCPNLAMFLGMDGKINVSHMPLVPLEKEGVKVASTAMLVDDSQKPIIWRGPLITKMLGDFFENTAWGELDYLIIDLPPGTSDAPLTIMQLLDLDGFVLVTTPQRIAAVNARRSGFMAKRLNVAVLGVIENMSDGEPSSSTRETANALETEILGSVKYDSLFNSFSDTGKIPVLENDALGERFGGIVRALGAKSSQV